MREGGGGSVCVWVEDHQFRFSMLLIRNTHACVCMCVSVSFSFVSSRDGYRNEGDADKNTKDTS